VRRTDAGAMKPLGGRTRRKSLHWFKALDKSLEWTSAAAPLCSSRHDEHHLITPSDRSPGRTPAANKAAIIWRERTGKSAPSRTSSSIAKVSKFANCLKGSRRGKGRPRRLFYMPLLLETAVGLAGLRPRIGAIHNVVFGGFSPDALSDRINDSRLLPSSSRQTGAGAGGHRLCR